MNEKELDIATEKIAKIKDAVRKDLRKVVADNAHTLWVDEDGTLYPYSCLIACLETALMCAMSMTKGENNEIKEERAKNLVLMALSAL